jgi:DNA-binding sugar fermentation-stimulating protein
MKQAYNETLDFPTFKGKLGKYDITASKMDIYYKQHDPRAWTAIINSGVENILVTYFINRNDIGERNFDIITENKSYKEVEEEDIYQTIDLLVKKTPPTETTNRQ